MYVLWSSISKVNFLPNKFLVYRYSSKTSPYPSKEFFNFQPYMWCLKCKPIEQTIPILAWHGWLCGLPLAFYAYQVNLQMTQEWLWSPSPWVLPFNSVNQWCRLLYIFWECPLHQFYAFPCFLCFLRHRAAIWHISIGVNWKPIWAKVEILFECILLHIKIQGSSLVLLRLQRWPCTFQ